MAIVINNVPANFDFSKNIMKVDASSDTNLVVSAGTAYSLELAHVSGTNSLGGTFVFEWATDSVVFIVSSVLTPDPTNKLVRIKSGGESWMDYLVYLKTRFQENIKFNDNYTFSLNFSGAGSLIITAKEVSEEFILVRSVFTNVGLTGTEYEAFVEPEILGDKMKIQLKVEVSESNTSSTFIEAATKIQEVIDGHAIFFIQDLVNPFLTYHIPSLQLTNSVQVLSTYKQVRLTLNERFGNPEENYSEVVLDPYFALKAGLTKSDFIKINRSTYPNVEAYYDYNKLFLTRAPRVRKTTSDSYEFLYFLFLNPSSIPDVRLMTVAYYEGNKTVTSYSNDRAVTEKEIYCYSTNLVNLGIFTSYLGNKLIKYTCCLVQHSTEVSETFTYLFDDAYYIDSNSYLFTNSDSGCDTFRFTGKLDEDPNFTYDTAKRIVEIPDDGVIESTQFSDFFNSSTVKIRKFKQSTGFITKAELKWLDELFVSENKFIIRNSKLVPIIITSQSKPSYSSQQNLNSFEFEFYAALEESVTDIDNTIVMKPA